MTVQAVDNRKEIATTILNQMGGSRLLTMMIGAKNFMYDKNDVSFRFMKSEKNKANYIKISLNANDLYDIEFLNIHGMSCKNVGTINGVFFDDLIRIFEEETNLSLRVPKFI